MANRRHFLLGLGGCACCLARPARASALPTDLEPLIGPDYQPVDTDERGNMQGYRRVRRYARGSASEDRA